MTSVIIYRWSNPLRREKIEVNLLLQFISYEKTDLKFLSNMDILESSKKASSCEDRASFILGIEIHKNSDYFVSIARCYP